MTSTVNLLSTSKCFGGLVKRYSHYSECCACEMKFHVFEPPAATSKPAVLLFLSGLTCNDENFITKAGAIEYAYKNNLFLVCPDTSPRGCKIEGEDDSWDFGTGAGFYVDATTEKWCKNYNMYSYISEELYNIVNKQFSVNVNKWSIFGHSMGGMGALVIALRNPGKYQSVSAFAPISNPVDCQWGLKNFSNYLGTDDKSKWEQYDPSILARNYKGSHIDILVDQGTEDNFLEEQLKPQTLQDACEANPQHLALSLRKQEGYNHNYFFISTFIKDHIEFHAQHLNQQ
ncbi:hypothetical protein CYY_000394 [Polysphondylium violaceum]|uniref:S-formylglutathione hydrolase n=1 Tax=Polysphondylium violaceum TaxID=133409 RepID=A0A8J4V900_9MYCE|nr:hypothetical protein CYY_000394 [Polysphondylium violaceum]